MYSNAKTPVDKARSPEKAREHKPPTMRRRVMNWLFAKAWAYRLEEGDEIIRVTGWRSCLIDKYKCSRSRIEFLFWWE